ncbi:MULTISPECIES: hypothetical protein [Photorhabdus]|nr:MULTISPECIES: hypothetical protein [Photorhabdus]MCC8390952.1 hypothetical protein [Photorhabdus laumondii]NDL18837.1 hypothetical protein [Photorhabdus laumondii subsp. laumondii]NDL50909.1 hypothetical protein [Photorhabdus laumondii subsp. laumondii]NDL55226.1 hypothetical protein [Photorhabdus laumondii subsp. laumondii]
MNITTDIPMKMFGYMGEKPDFTFLSEEGILLWGFLDVIGYLIIRVA